MKIYLASSLQDGRRKEMFDAQEILISKGHDVYCPVMHKIHNAWDYPNPEWGLMVFQSDLIAIQNADAVVVLSHGREESTAGVDWEAGFAFGIGVERVAILKNGIDDIRNFYINDVRFLREFKEVK